MPITDNKPNFHPCHVILTWHVHWTYGARGCVFYCCVVMFTSWLKQRYGNIAYGFYELHSDTGLAYGTSIYFSKWFLRYACVINFNTFPASHLLLHKQLLNYDVGNYSQHANWTDSETCRCHGSTPDTWFYCHCIHFTSSVFHNLIFNLYNQLYTSGEQAFIFASRRLLYKLACMVQNLTTRWWYTQ